MTDPADRHPDERYLEGRLHALASGVSAPVVPASDDVRRGRRRLLRVRLAMAGATTSTLVVVLGITSLTAGRPQASDVEPMTTPPSTSLPASPDASPTQDVSGDDGSAGPDETGGGDVAVSTRTSRGGDETAGAGLGVLGKQPGEQPGDEPAGSVAGEPRGGAAPAHWPTHAATSDTTAEPSAQPTDDVDAVPTSPPGGTPTEEPTETPTEPPVTPPPTTGKVRVNKVLAYFDDVLAEHLDHLGDHLRDFDPAVDPRTTSRRAGRLLALGATYRWEGTAEPGGVELRVASGWDQVAWGCGAAGSRWVCHPAGAAEVGVHDGLREVAVEHADGQVVVVAAALPEADLVAAASDERLVVPGDAPIAPPRLDPETFASSGVAAMVLDGESFSRTSLDRTPTVRGTWTVDGTVRGALAWTVDPVYSGAGWTCLRTYRLCTDIDVEVDGVTHTVHLGLLNRSAGGGWVVQHDGPSYVVRVTTSRGFPKKRAYRFVTDDAWQPVRR